MSYMIYRNGDFVVELSNEEFKILKRNDPTVTEIKMARMLAELEEKIDIQNGEIDRKNEKIEELESRNRELSSDISAKVEDTIAQAVTLAEAGVGGEKYGKK